jgi:hypothetical protein
MAEPTTRARRPKRPAHLPHGRWLGDLGDLSPLEKRLVAACARGEVCAPDNWDGKRPEADAATETNTIRAEIIRFLALGGDDEHPVHEDGVMLRGVWIKGELSLHQAKGVVRLDLRFCHFDSEPVFTAARLPELVLSGSKVPSLRADRMIVKGSVFLRNGFEASGAVRLLGAQIESDLDCSDGKFSNPSGYALNADGVVVNGYVFLGNGFEASGEVRLLSAQIGRNLECTNGKFSNPSGYALHAGGAIVNGYVFLRNGFEASGEVCLLSAQIGRNLECSNGKFDNTGSNALRANRVVVTGGVFLRDATIKGAIYLTAARIGTLIDDIACWQAGGHIFDGLHYKQVIGSTDAAMRIGWLKTQRDDQLTSDFRPQPWEQLIKTLREMGHPYEAAQVAMAKQRQLRKAGQIKGPVRYVMHWLYGVLAGYGHRPIWTVGWMTAVWLACALVFSTAAHFGAIGPAAPVMMVNQQVAKCGVDGEVDFDHYWVRCPDMPPEYTSFDPLLYSLDLILPLVDLQQDSDWAPVIANSKGIALPLGWWARSFMWFEILFGWMASLMLVAVLGRLVDKD